MTSTNQYKNALGIYPKEWRVPLTVRRKNESREMLVRLMGNQEKEREKPPGNEPPAPKGRGPVPVPKGNGETAKMYQTKPG